MTSASAAHATHDQHGFGIRLEWGRRGVQALASSADVVVIVDVLSFSTTVSVAVERGAAVIPHVPRDDSAAERARALGAILANPRRAGPGPTLSPQSLTDLRRGESLLLASPNGATCSLLAAQAGALVVAGCLRNATAVAAFATARGGTVAVIPAGEAWAGGELRPCAEDLLGAGAVLASMDALRMSPEARVAVAAFTDARADLRERLRACSSGRELVHAGFEIDVTIAAELDATIVVPVLRDEAFRAEAA